jgi:DNA-binding NarL/FixJ family response regulator
MAETADGAVSTKPESHELITLVLADHHPLTLQGLCQLFGNEEEFTVLAACADGQAALEALRKHNPSVLVLDVELPPNGAFAVLHEIQRQRLPTHAVLLAGTQDDDQALDAVRFGARGLVLKEMPPDSLMRCVKGVHAGEHWLADPAIRRSRGELFREEIALRRSIRGLTPRETEIVRLAIRGVPTKDIAVRLAVRQGTVKVHLHNIYDKLQVNGRLGLILFARRQGLV